MKALTFLSLLLCPVAKSAPTAANVVLAIHGGTADHEKIPPAEEQAYRAALEAALKAGQSVLNAKGSALDAVEAAVKVMEDDAHFNAGRGAVLTHDGKIELEASVMDGKTGKAGAVTGVTRVRNPISAARLVMEKTPHVFLGGDAVEKIAKENRLALVSPAYFRTDRRVKELEKVKKKKQEEEGKAGTGTVGAVALDTAGNLAVATSTGGRVNKLHGRIGDTPIIGASTYAENGVGAISTTGHGEFFIRLVAAFDIIAQMKYRNLAVDAAADEIIQKKMRPLNARGGAIVLDPQGNLAFSFNTVGMPRGYVTREGKIETSIFETKAEQPAR